MWFRFIDKNAQVSLQKNGGNVAPTDTPARGFDVTLPPGTKVEDHKVRSLKITTFRLPSGRVLQWDSQSRKLAPITTLWDFAHDDTLKKVQ